MISLPDLLRRFRRASGPRARARDPARRRGRHQQALRELEVRLDENDSEDAVSARWAAEAPA